MARTFVQILDEAREYEYKPPTKEKIYWDNDDYFFKAITIVIHEPDLLKATDIICGWFPPLKMLFKSTIKRYIHYCNR